MCTGQSAQNKADIAIFCAQWLNNASWGRWINIPCAPVDFPQHVKWIKKYMHFIRPEDWQSSFHKDLIGGIRPESMLYTSEQWEWGRNKYISTPPVLYVQWTQQHINLSPSCHIVRLKRLKLSCQRGFNHSIRAKARGSHVKETTMLSRLL